MLNRTEKLQRRSRTVMQKFKKSRIFFFLLLVAVFHFVLPGRIQGFVADTQNLPVPPEIVLTEIAGQTIAMPAMIETAIPEIVNHTFQAGDILPFGSYYWRVLDVRGNDVLIITENVIMSMAYNITWNAATWETSDIRRYLNSEFYKSFYLGERKQIRETNVINSNNQWFDIYGGNDTKDRVFLLSLEEVVKYFGDSGKLQNRPNQNTWLIDDVYNNARIAKNADGVAVRWWLRSQGDYSCNAARVSNLGEVNVIGNRVHDFNGGLRPALWLNLALM